MVSLKPSEMGVFDDGFDMRSGNVLDFSDRTMAEFFDDKFGIDIREEKYQFAGTSKAKRLRAFMQPEDEYTSRGWHAPYGNTGRVCRTRTVRQRLMRSKGWFFDLVFRIEGGGAVPRTDVLERFKSDETLEELIAAIERDIGGNKPASVLDRLHTYCMKEFAYLLQERGIISDRNDPLKSRVATAG